MITLLLTNSKNKVKLSQARYFFQQKQGKQKEDEKSTSEKTESEDNPNFELLKSSSEEKGGSENRDNHSRRMNELEKCLEAITNRSNFQEARVV